MLRPASVAAVSTAAEAPRRDRTAQRLLPAASGLAWLLAIASTGGPSALLVWLAFTAGLVLPATALVGVGLRRVRVPARLRPGAAGALALPLLMAVYLGRKLVPATPPVLDLTTILVLHGLAARLQAWRPLWRDLRPAAAGLGPLVGIVLPVLLALIWTGFEVHDGEAVRYYGLFLIDLGNLAAYTTMVTTADWLPHAVADTGPLAYHWLYFSLPAYLSGFLGADLRNTTAVALANLLPAVLLFQAVYVFAGSGSLEAGAGRSRTRFWAVAIVLLASSIAAFYQAVSPELGWLASSARERNALLLSLPSSMIFFGNNTLALVHAILAVGLLHAWNRGGRLAPLMLAGVALVLVGAFSITLAFPLGVGLLALALSGWLRQPVRALVLLALVGVAGLAVLALLGYFSGPAYSLGLAFDGGRFLRNVLLTFAPVLLLAALGLRRGGLPRAALVFAAACLLVPTLLYVRGSASGHNDFSLKTATLFVVLLAPLVGRGVAAVRTPRAPRWMRGAAYTLGLLGFLHLGGYAGQFLYYRWFEPLARQGSISREYWEALRYIRERTPLEAVVADPLTIGSNVTNFTLMLGEREVLLPSEYNVSVGDRTRLRERISSWRERGPAGLRRLHDQLHPGRPLYLVSQQPPDAARWQRVWGGDSISVHLAR